MTGRSKGLLKWGDYELLAWGNKEASWRVKVFSDKIIDIYLGEWNVIYKHSAS